MKNYEHSLSFKLKQELYKRNARKIDRIKSGENIDPIAVVRVPGLAEESYVTIPGFKQVARVDYDKWKADNPDSPEHIIEFR